MAEEQTEYGGVVDKRPGWLWMYRADFDAAAKARGARGVAVYAAVCYYANAAGLAWPSTCTIAEQLAIDRHEVSSVLKDLEAVGLISLKPRPGTSALIVLPNAKPSDGKPAPSRPSSRPATGVRGASAPLVPGDLVPETPGTLVGGTPSPGVLGANPWRPSHLEQEPVTRITNKNHEGALARAPAPVRGSTANRSRFSAAVEYARARLGALPNGVQREAIDRAVTAGDAAMLERWKRCVDAWRLAGHSPVNIAGVLDWFKAGGPPGQPAANSGGNGKRRPEVRRNSRYTEEELRAAREADAGKEWADPDEVLDGPARAGPGPVDGGGPEGGSGHVFPDAAEYEAWLEASGALGEDGLPTWDQLLGGPVYHAWRAQIAGSK
ncbi:MAG: helix-turn-helix domain-containing protein [Chloroflexota bacterium]